MAHALSSRDHFLREHSPVLAVSALLHGALFVLLVANLNLLPAPPPQPVRLAIQATVVDARAMRQRAAEEERIERELAEARQRREEERQAAIQQREEEQRRQVEEQRQAAEQKRQAQAKQKQEAEKLRLAKLEQQKQAAEAQKKAAAAAADAKRKAEAEKKQAQSKADLARQMAEEEDLNAAADSGELDQYREVIRQKVQRNWSTPATARPGDNCDVRVQQIPGGEVVSAVAVNCTGDAAFARSVENAVLRSSPLPLPANPKLFDRNLLFNFKPES